MADIYESVSWLISRHYKNIHLEVVFVENDDLPSVGMLPGLLTTFSKPSDSWEDIYPLISSLPVLHTVGPGMHSVYVGKESITFASLPNWENEYKFIVYDSSKSKWGHKSILNLYRDNARKWRLREHWEVCVDWRIETKWYALKCNNPDLWQMVRFQCYHTFPFFATLKRQSSNIQQNCSQSHNCGSCEGSEFGRVDPNDVLVDWDDLLPKSQNIHYNWNSSVNRSRPRKHCWSQNYIHGLGLTSRSIQLFLFFLPAILT